MNDLELWRAHEGLTIAAQKRRQRQDADPYRSYLDSLHRGHNLPGSADDRGVVPPGLQDRLAAIAEKRGYPVRYTSKATVARLSQSDGAVGLTVHEVPPWAPAEWQELAAKLPPKGVYLAADHLNAAALARVTIHELGHVYSLARVKPELEEPLAESLAGIVGRELGVTDGRFSVAYLAQQDDYVLDAVRPYACSLAVVILDELGELR